MHIDLSTLPPLTMPSPPSNTLLITNLSDPAIFAQPTLQTIRTLISQHAPLHSFSPLKSFRRIIVSFETVDQAIAIRQLVDGTAILGCRARVYFGEPTPIHVGDVHLAAPAAQKLFFISPPPSPPLGWEMRNEGPPNKAAHADDLACALARLRARPGANGDVSPVEMEDVGEGMDAGRRRRGSSTVVYHPKEHGGSPGLPAVTVEDTTESNGDRDEDTGMREAKIITHTARPPVELMDCD